MTSRRLISLAMLTSLLVLLVACGQSAPAAAPTTAPTKPAAAAPTTAPAATKAPEATKAPAAATTAPAATTMPTAAAKPAASPAAQTGPIAKPNGYPSKPVQVVVPFNPGGGADNSQRVFNKYAEPIIGQQMVIVNKPGAGGATGWAEMVRSAPDGYTMSIITPPFNIIPALVTPQQTGYKLDQFKYVAIYAIVPDVLYVRADSQFKTFDDLVKYAKDNPGKIKAANTGTLGADHLTTLMIENAAGVEFTQVPFTGGAESLQATLAGTTDVMVASSNFIKAQEGKLRPLGIATEQRDPLFPNVPTFKEQGYDVVSERYRVFGGPQGLPQDIVDYWAKVAKQVTSTDGFKQDMEQQGQPPAYLGPDEAKQRIDRMTKDIQAIVDKYNLAKK